MIYTYLNIKRKPRKEFSGSFYWGTARKGLGAARRRKPNPFRAQPIHRFDFKKVS